MFILLKDRNETETYKPPLTFYREGFYRKRHARGGCAFFYAIF